MWWGKWEQVLQMAFQADGAATYAREAHRRQAALPEAKETPWEVGGYSLHPLKAIN